MESSLDRGIELGTLLGRGQALSLVANQSLAKQAEYLRIIRDTELYKTTGRTWEQFCRDLVGMSRQSVETLIQNEKELGAIYLRLCEIVRISPETYTAGIASHIVGEQLEIDGELIDIIPENSLRIRQSVLRLRAQLQRTVQKAKQKQSRLSLEAASGPWLGTVRTRISDSLQEMLRMAECAMPPAGIDALRQLIADFRLYLDVISKELDDTARVLNHEDTDPVPPSAG